jgi:hypothetical protein
VKEEGLDVGACDLDKVTALHVAAFFGHSAVLRTLKELGAGHWRPDRKTRNDDDDDDDDDDPLRPLSMAELDVRPPHSRREGWGWGGAWPLKTGSHSLTNAEAPESLSLPRSRCAVYQRAGEDVRRRRSVRAARGGGSGAGAILPDFAATDLPLPVSIPKQLGWDLIKPVSFQFLVRKYAP